MDKYEELYNLSKYLLSHEIDRQKRLDEKASKYLAVITILVGGYGFFANHLLNEMTPLRQWVFLEWALGIAIVSVLAALVITWVIIFKSLKTIELHQIPMNDEMITFFDTHLDIIKEPLIAGEDVMISGFGKWTVKSKHARRGRNPQTGEQIILDARRVVTCIYSPVLKKAVNGDRSGLKKR